MIKIELEYEDGTKEVKEWKGTLDSARWEYEGKYIRDRNSKDGDIKECINIRIVY